MGPSASWSSSGRTQAGFFPLESACAGWQQDREQQEWFCTASAWPVTLLGIARFISRGSRSKRESVLAGDGGAGGKKVGAVFLVPGRVRFRALGIK